MQGTDACAPAVVGVAVDACAAAVVGVAVDARRGRGGGVERRGQTTLLAMASPHHIK